MNTLHKEPKNGLAAAIFSSWSGWPQAAFMMPNFLTGCSWLYTANPGVATLGTLTIRLSKERLRRMFW